MTVTLKRFDDPDERREFPKGRFELVHIGGMTIGRATNLVGVGPKMSDRAWARGVAKSSTLASSFRVEQPRPWTTEPPTMGTGDCFYIPPGHDSWVVGDEPYVSLHLLGAEKYAAAEPDGET